MQTVPTERSQYFDAHLHQNHTAHSAPHHTSFITKCLPDVIWICSSLACCSVVFPECLQSRQTQLYKLYRADALSEPILDPCLTWNFGLKMQQVWPYDTILNSPFICQESRLRQVGKVTLSWHFLRTVNVATDIFLNCLEVAVVQANNLFLFLSTSFPISHLHRAELCTIKIHPYACSFFDFKEEKSWLYLKDTVWQK